MTRFAEAPLLTPTEVHPRGSVLKHLFSAPPAMAFFACGNVRLMLSRPEDALGERVGATLYFRVADITVLRKEPAACG